MANAAIGSRISLISKSEIRYEGFLDHINTQENHVGLKNVRMFGTEGRKGGVSEVPASDNLYEFIIFRGGDIKDLSVFENQPRDPAIVNAKTSTLPASSQQQQQDNNNNNNGGSRSAWSNGPPTGMRSNNNNNNNGGGYNNNNQRQYGNGRDGGNYSQNQPQQQQQRTYGNGRDGGNYQQQQRGENNNNNHRGGYNNNNNGGGYRGGYNNNNQHNNNNSGPPRQVQHTGQDFQVAADPSKARTEVGTNFDFSKAQQEFERAKQEARDLRQQRGGASAANGRIEKYEKKDFFDNLSGGDDKKNQPQDFHARRMEREHQNANDTETFGSDMVAIQSTRGFGRGRGGRGGNGGGRGGYRGGNGPYNNNYRGGGRGGPQ
jgi:protein LSM14